MIISYLHLLDTDRWAYPNWSSWWSYFIFITYIIKISACYFMMMANKDMGSKSRVTEWILCENSSKKSNKILCLILIKPAGRFSWKGHYWVCFFHICFQYNLSHVWWLNAKNIYMSAKCHFHFVKNYLQLHENADDFVAISLTQEMGGFFC